MELQNNSAPLTRQKALDFLRAHLPQSDLDCYQEPLFLQFVDHALALRGNTPWCAELDEELFLHYVLFPRVNDEDLSFHREIFHNALWDRIKNLPTIEEKVLEVNRWCHENASYEMQDDRTASPLTVYRCGSGRCGEESVFLISALRSVGIPARQVYAPRWAHCDDNHAWVEVLCGGQWRFLGACEPEPVLDRGWFNSPASRALLVHSRVFGAAEHPLHGERISTENGVTWFNQTARYALTRRRTLRAEIAGGGAPGTVFLIQVLNESSFHTIAALTSDERGAASIELGDGDFHIFARCGAYVCECSSGADDVITLPLQNFYQCETAWREADYIAPVDSPRNPAPLDDGQKRCRAAVLADGRVRREARIAAMFPAGAENAPYADLLRAARGNAADINAFLLADADPRREIMLRSLSKKDLRDVTADVLESHLRALTPQGSLPEDIYRQYVLCPRIEIEPLTAWREELANALHTLPSEDPMALYRGLLAEMELSSANTYSNLVLPPAQAWQARRCSLRSFLILYTALLRTAGIPARLRSPDGEPEYFRNGAWHSLERARTATLRLISVTDAVYRQNWTISRWTGGEWTLLHPENGITAGGTLSLSLPEGFYRLITSVRMPNGNQFSAMREIVLRPGEQKDVPLHFRRYRLSDLLRRQRLPVMSAAALDGEHIPDICRLNGRPTLLFWPETGGEPTEHMLNEMISAAKTVLALPVDLVFLPQSRESLRQPTLARTLDMFPHARVLLSDWAYDLETVARHLTCDPDTPPLAIVCDRSGNAVYGMSGYSVGAVELLVRIAEHIAKES